MGSETVLESKDLKVRELLKEVQLDYSPELTKLVDDIVSSIKEAIDKIPEDLSVTVDIAPGFIRDIGADKVEFKFKKPKSVEIGGSYSIQCIAKPDVNVDLLIRLPKECFHEKDFLNHRYHAKRGLYLCIIKKYLKLSPLIQNVEWSSFQNEVRKPILVVRSAIKIAEVPDLVVRIIPTATSLFNISKLKLMRNNIRAMKQEEETVPQATPKYNCSILEDMFLEDRTELIKRTFLGWKALGEALILLKVWARQRKSIYVHDCLNGFLISILMSYLSTESRWINKSMNTMQIFRGTLDFIATSKVWDNGLYFKHQGEHNVSKEDKRQYTQSFPVVLCDLSSHFNLAFRLTRSGFLELRDEAVLTRKCMDGYKDGGFEEIFMTKIDYPAKYDYCIRLKLKGKGEVYASGFCLDDECWRLYEQKVYSILHEGLKDRVKFIRVTWRNTSSDCNIENGLSMFDRAPLLIGISISSFKKAFRVVDIGPNPENKEEARRFRTFWGEKAELRRFPDGVIAESTVWESRKWEKHLNINRIAEYVLIRHLSLSKENIMHIADQLDFSLQNGVGDPISFSQNLLDAFEALSKQLRLLHDIPLRVSSVQALDSALRLTAVYPPEPHPLAFEKGVRPKLQKLTSTCVQPLEVMIQLEGSGRWLMDDVAIEKTKSAFLLKIGESLQNNCGFACIATEDAVDVLVSGYAFRLKILHERALGLLKRQAESNLVKRVSDTDKKLFIRSQHSSMINSLQQKYAMYGPVVRLAKRWVASHLFSACLVEEAVELLVAHLFLKPLPFYAPSSRISGFLRFLRILSEYDWTFSPLVVDTKSDPSLENLKDDEEETNQSATDIKGDLSPKDEIEINEHFTSNRKSCEGNLQSVNPAMFLASAYDKASEAWTRSSPSPSELRRLVAYARSSADLLTKLASLDQAESDRWECLFRTPLNNYDAVILLHRDRIPYPQRLLFPSELDKGRLVACGNASKDFHPFILSGNVKMNSKELKDKLMVDFDPLKCFLVDLEREFPAVFKVWFDSLGGDAIGLTWDRSSSKKRGREEADENEIDQVGMLKAVGDVGKGFVRSIYCLKSPKLMN